MQIARRCASGRSDGPSNYPRNRVRDFDCAVYCWHGFVEWCVMLAIVNVTREAAKTGLNHYEVRVNDRVIATFEHNRNYGAAAQCLRDAADAVERCSEERQHKLILSLLPMFERMQSGEEK